MRKAYAAVLAALVFVAGCSSGTTTAPGGYSSDPKVLSIVMGSEQHLVFDQIVRPWCEKNGLTCTPKELGSVDQANLLSEDCSNLPPYDVFWFASTVFEQIGNERCGKLVDSKPMFSSPVVFAGWRHVMDRLGFTPGSNTSIQQILDVVEAGKAKVWITNPTQSNSGATAFFGFLNYFAGNPPGKALTQEQLDSEPVRSGITRLMSKFDHTPPSTKTLMDDCIAAPDRCEAVFTYEALVIETNRDRVPKGEEPMTVVYPQGSLAFADSPLGFLPHGDNSEKQANFVKLQTYLLSPEAQQALLLLGRRPVNSSGLSLPNLPQDLRNTVFRPDWGIVTDRQEQPIRFPAASVIQNALYNYNVEYRQPGNFVYCLDGSGSMQGDGWNGVQQAADILFDPDTARRYMLLANPKDSTTVFVFDDGIKGGPWTVNGNRKDDLLGLRKDITDSSPGGGTNIRGCLQHAVDVFGSYGDDGRKKAVVLMTDGQDGGDDNTAIEELAQMGIPVIAIGFGDVDEHDLRDVIAAGTGGTYIHKDSVVGALRDAAGFR
ncbi:VWA domain-containing protein [Candidatus Mycolicibacterium alkanivorans]|uniref:VWA domain-containing protein n=1 Tax=Candidatus Mycolicibacterium alkanivorans TaxID=2954114 RepID=A0ABS9YYA3_9MYCO|nr:VWA domain-containing protein [Candidatus Mycolicibacterium alkanivorans]MCI4676082.1 VWA domain-containing protein [Candidatus Mycolicibacterium alkanivorans]